MKKSYAKDVRIQSMFSQPMDMMVPVYTIVVIVVIIAIGILAVKMKK